MSTEQPHRPCNILLQLYIQPNFFSTALEINLSIVEDTKSFVHIIYVI